MELKKLINECEKRTSVVRFYELKSDILLALKDKGKKKGDT